MKSYKEKFDAIIVGSGIGVVTASQLAAKGAKVLVLEKYIIPGSGGSFKKGYTFDVGASMIFGFGDRGYTNLLTRALRMLMKHAKLFLIQCNWNITFQITLVFLSIKIMINSLKNYQQLFPRKKRYQKIYDTCAN